VTKAIEVPSDYPAEGVELRLIQRFVAIEDRSVLEIGCGDGRLTRQYAPLASKVVAIESDATKIRIARRRAADEGVTNVSFRVGNAERTRLGGGPFDIALFSWSL
jgi:ubiquinone/menaquinone biosynthesis C-methylase UbiE